MKSTIYPMYLTKKKNHKNYDQNIGRKFYNWLTVNLSVRKEIFDSKMCNRQTNEFKACAYYSKQLSV